ncbi:MAG: hypothetical protein ACP5NL_04355 [Thermoplasmata archaeon]
MKIVYDKEEGIASVVGTLFSLLLFITLLSTFVTQYVPVYMKTNEEQHDMQVLSQFSQIRTEVDMLTITNDLNYTTYAPITMGAAGIPLFAQQTIGELEINPYAQNLSNQFMNISFQYPGIGLVNLYAGGSIEFIAPNRYYVPESFIYFNGALIRTNLAQNNASVILVGSDFSATNSSGVHLTFVMQHIYGVSDVVTGTDTRGIAITLFGTQKNVYSLSNHDLNVTFNTTFNSALLQYYKNMAISNQVITNNPTPNQLEFKDVVSVTVLNVYLYVTITQ